MMSWLRTYKTDPGVTKLKCPLTQFLTESDITLEDLNMFMERGMNLVSFEIEIVNNEITFKSLNKSKKNRYIWESLE